MKEGEDASAAHGNPLAVEVVILDGQRHRRRIYLNGSVDFCLYHNRQIEGRGARSRRGARGGCGSAKGTLLMPRTADQCRARDHSEPFVIQHISAQLAMLGAVNFP